jgi:hypothetical protein
MSCTGDGGCLCVLFRCWLFFSRLQSSFNTHIIRLSYLLIEKKKNQGFIGSKGTTLLLYCFGV